MDIDTSNKWCTRIYLAGQGPDVFQRDNKSLQKKEKEQKLYTPCMYIPIVVTLYFFPYFFPISIASKAVKLVIKYLLLVLALKLQRL